MLDFQLLVRVFIELQFVSYFLQLSFQLPNHIILFQQFSIQLYQLLTWFPIFHFETLNLSFQLENQFFFLFQHLSQSADVYRCLFDLLSFLEDFEGLFLILFN